MTVIISLSIYGNYGSTVLTFVKRTRKMNEDLKPVLWECVKCNGALPVPEEGAEFVECEQCGATYRFERQEKEKEYTPWIYTSPNYVVYPANEPWKTYGDGGWNDNTFYDDSTAGGAVRTNGSTAGLAEFQEKFDALYRGVSSSRVTLGIDDGWLTNPIQSTFRGKPLSILSDEELHEMKVDFENNPRILSYNSISEINTALERIGEYL
jgi:hypothetical protein